MNLERRTLVLQGCTACGKVSIAAYLQGAMLKASCWTHHGIYIQNKGASGITPRLYHHTGEEKFSPIVLRERHLELNK